MNSRKYSVVLSCVYIFIIDCTKIGRFIVDDDENDERQSIANIWQKLELKPKSVRVVFDKNEENNLKLMNINVKTFSRHSQAEIVEFHRIEHLKFQSQFSVIFSDSQVNLEQFLAKLDTKKFLVSGQFLIITSDCTLINSQRLLHLAWQKYIVNLNIVCKFNSTISMQTFLPFTQHASKIAELNYDEKNFEFFPKKLTNFHLHPVKVATFYYPPITMREELSNGTHRFYGSEMDLIYALASSLNFTVEMNFVNKTGASGILHDNGTATGFLKQTIDGEVDVLIGFYYLTFLRTQFLSFTDSHYSIPLVIMIPFGQPFSAFEKLFVPLQTSVWIVLLITSLGGMFVISVIHFQRNESIKKFIFGENFQNPYMSMLIVAMGSDLKVLPRRNFARSLLMMFMLFCLVLRSIYQGSLFLVLQKDGRHPEVRSIDEMMEKSFVFYIRETIEHNIKNMPFYDRRKVVKFDDYPMLREKTLNPFFKGGVIQPLLEVIYLNQQNYKNFTYNVLREYLFDIQIVYYFPKNSYLVDALNEKMGILKSAGLVNRIMERYIDRGYVKMNQDHVGARSMNISQLSGSFEMLIIGYCSGIVIFIIELIIDRTKAIMEKRKIANKSKIVFSK